jgi:RHS repeat-associated protein
VECVDALGNRVATKVNDVWQFVIYDAFGKLVAEYGNQGEGVGGVSYVLQDWQGSVRASVNANGFIQARFDFTAFGEEVSLGVGLRSLEQGYTGDATTKQGYGLTEKDSSGQNHTWFRKQEQRAGRWTSPDPYKGSMSLGNPQSFNRYSYVNNDAVNFVDPSGLNASSSGGYSWSCWITWSSNSDGSNFKFTSVSCWNTGGGSGGSSGGSDVAVPSLQPKPAKGTINKEVLAKCLKDLYQLTLGNFQQATGKQNGSFSATDFSKIFSDSENATLNFSINTKSYTLGDITDGVALNNIVQQSELEGFGSIKVQGFGFLLTTNNSGNGELFIGSTIGDLAFAQITAISQIIEKSGIGKSDTSLASCLKDNNGIAD